jgi:hypothetical protein
LSKNHVPRNSEIYLPNEYYGFDLIIKDHLKIDSEKKLYFALPHGVEVADYKNWNLFGKSERIGTLIFTNQLSKQNLIQNKTCGFRFHGTSPMLILFEKMRSLELLPSTLALRSALFFPTHGNPEWFLENKSYDQEVCNFLKKIYIDYEKIDVSLTASDIRQGRHKTYENNGFSVITAGDIYDPYFSSRFINNVHRYGFILTAEIGSHIFYCAAFGLRVLWCDLGLQPLQDFKNSEGEFYPKPRVFPAILEFTEFLGTPNAKTIANSFLGVRKDGFFASYSSIHLLSRIIDFLGFLEPQGKRIKLATPRFWRRSLLFIFQRLKLK